MKLPWQRGDRGRGSGLEQRLAALEDAVQGLADLLRPEPEHDAAPPPPTEGAAPASPYAVLLDRHMPPGERVVVIGAADDLHLRALGRPATGFLPAIDRSAAAVARVEAERSCGGRFLLIPEAAQASIDGDARLREHLIARFHTIAEEPGVGALLVEVASQGVAAADQTPLGMQIERIADRAAPLLDWTAMDLVRLLPGRYVLKPVEPADGELPHLDHTIDVVLVDSAARMDEAARVAAGAVVRVAPAEGGGANVVEMRRLRAEGDPPTLEPIVVVVPTDPADEWLDRVRDAVATRPGATVEAATDPIAAAAAGNAPAVVLAERGVLPLPGCIEAAERLLAGDDRLGGVAVKLFCADGSLEAAGGAAFADGTVAGIARGAPAPAPWHEYVRPVSAAIGLMVLRAAAVPSLAPDRPRAFDLARLSAALWTAGWEVHYQPDAAAVRALVPAQGELSYGTWPESLDGRPPRPLDLGEGTWRRLLAREKLGGPAQ